MNKYNLFPHPVSKSKTVILVAVLIISVLIPIAVNLLFLSKLFKQIVENQLYFVLIGIIIYGAWLAILFFLYSKDSISLKDLTVTKQKLKTGLLAGLYIFIAVNFLLLAFALINHRRVMISEDFNSASVIFRTFGKFIFNVLPGTFIEELIFRAYLLPQIFLRINNKLSNAALSLVITILVTQALFAFAHIPRDFFRFNYDLSTVGNNIPVLFFSGIVFSIMFLKTKNIFLVTIFHAFMNFSLPVINSPSSASFNFYAIVAAIIITLFRDKILEPKRYKAG